jgi:hypothetical protein
MSIPKTMNLPIVQGRTFSRRMIFFINYDNNQLMDLTGYTFNAQVREHQDLKSKLLATFNITVDLTASAVKIELTKSQTADIPIGVSWWDLVVTDPQGVVSSYLSGQIICRGGATEV